MPSLVRMSSLTVALAVAAVGPGLAQQSSTTKSDVAKPAGNRAGTVPVGEEWAQAGTRRACGAWYVCHNRIPIICTPDTRPYENVAEHKCLCVHDGCPGSNATLSHPAGRLLQDR
jgi:hypothetical protein